MLNVKRTLQMTSLLFGMIILFSYIGWCLGYEGFIIAGHVNVPLWLIYIICPVLLSINLSLYAGYVLNIYSWKVLWFSIPLSLISAIGANWLPYELFTGPIPALILIVIILYKKIGPTGFTRLILINLAVLLWQWATSKFSVINLSASDISMYQTFRLSISAIILMALFYSIGGAKYAHVRLESLVFPGRIRDDKHRNGGSQIDPQTTDDVPVDKFEKWVMRSVIGVVQIVQWLFILWVCNLDNLFLDALVLTTSFICHGMIISKRKHLKPIILCTLAATAMFYFAARFTISVQYSQFFPILIGLILSYTIYRVSYQLEISAKEKAQKELERIKVLEEQVTKAWERLDELSN